MQLSSTGGSKVIKASPMDALRAKEKAIQEVRLSRLASPKDPETVRAMIAVQVLSSKSPPIWVSPDISDALREARHQLEPSVRLEPEMIPREAGYVHFGGQPWVADDKEMAGFFFGWLPETRQLSLWALVTTNEGESGVRLSSWLLDEELGMEDRRSNEDFRIAAYSVFAFLSHPLAQLEETKTDRATRRRAAREGRPEPELHVLSLRRTERASGRSHSSTGQHLTKRHIVSGHWRHYWYGPKDGERHRRARWIFPFFQGPDDAPLGDPKKIYKIVGGRG